MHKLFADGSFVSDFLSWTACRAEGQARSEANVSVKYVCVPDPHAQRLGSVAYLAGNRHIRIIDSDGSVLWTAAHNPKHL